MCATAGANNWSNNSKGSYLVRLLPFMDQSAMYSMIRWGEGPAWVVGQGNVEATVDANGKLLRTFVMPEFTCPSDTAPATIAHGAKSSYGFSIGAQLMPGNATPWGTCTLYPGNVFGTGAAGHANPSNPEPQNYSGFASRLNWASNMRDLTDGSSNTIALGEIRPDCSDHTQNGWFHFNGMWIATTAPINYPIICRGEPGWNSATPPPLPGGGGTATACNYYTNWQTSQGFKSKHVGGAHMLLGDGHVVFMSQNIDYITYQKLGDRRDGQPIGEY
jgi:hypothetical protein